MAQPHPYLGYKFLYPPRPETKVPKDMLIFLESQGYVAQIKRDGDCTCVFAKGDEVIFRTRQDTELTRWQPSPAQINFFKGFRHWNAFATERVGDTLYIFDIMVRTGDHLVGVSFTDRQKILHQIWPTMREEQDEFRVTSWLTVAKSHTRGFDEIFKNLKPTDEGLVMKRPDSVLKSCARATTNGDWQVKCRKPTKKASF